MKINKKCANCSLDIPKNRDGDGYCRYDGIERLLQGSELLECPHWILRKPDSNFAREVKRKLSEYNYLEMINK